MEMKSLVDLFTIGNIIIGICISAITLCLSIKTYKYSKIKHIPSVECVIVEDKGRGDFEYLTGYIGNISNKYFLRIDVGNKYNVVFTIKQLYISFYNKNEQCNIYLHSRPDYHGRYADREIAVASGSTEKFFYNIMLIADKEYLQYLSRPEETSPHSSVRIPTVTVMTDFQSSASCPLPAFGMPK